MNNNADKFLIRAKDITLLISAISLGAYAMKVSAKPALWDRNMEEVAAMKPVVYQTRSKADVLEAHFDEILRRLDRIERKIDR